MARAESERTPGMFTGFGFTSAAVCAFLAAGWMSLRIAAVRRAGGTEEMWRSLLLAQLICFALFIGAVGLAASSFTGAHPLGRHFGQVALVECGWMAFVAVFWYFMFRRALRR
jgi:hypothetical protein